MAAAAMALTAVSSTIGALGQLQKGQADAAAFRFNKEVAMRNSELSLNQAQADADASDRQSRDVLGSMKANYGASGVTTDSGSVSDVLANSASLAELDKQNILYKGKLKAMGYSEEASLDEFNANRAIKESKYAAASTILQGGAQAARYSTSSGGGAT